MSSDTETTKTQDAAKKDPKDPNVILPEDLPADKEHSTKGAWSAGGEKIDYKATVGTLKIDTTDVKPAASIFYSMFEAVDADGKADASRPVTFIFNGGPGASSTFLMMGSFGPQRIDLPDVYEGKGAPYKIVENNEFCLLPITDLVFIDAPGAGFSIIADKAKKDLWSVDGDIAGFTTFIKNWCTKYGRWNSPKYLFGESYGTTRGSLLTLKMQQEGIALTGACLISCIFDYSYTFDDNDEYYIGYLPTYAMISQYHKKAGKGESEEEWAQEARKFAELYRRALAMGNRLDKEDAKLIAEKYSQMTGLGEEYLISSSLRVPDGRFRKKVLRSEGKVVGRYDGRVSGYDTDPESADQTFIVDDAFLSPAYEATVNDYLRRALGWDTDKERIAFAPFDWTSTVPGKGWVWTHKLPDHVKADEWGYVPFPNTLHDMCYAILQEPKLKIMLGNGYYDMATPFYQTEYDVDHIELPDELKGNIALTYYKSGHMIYTVKDALTKLYSDLKKFYAADAKDMPSIDERPKAGRLGL